MAALTSSPHVPLGPLWGISGPKGAALELCRPSGKNRLKIDKMITKEFIN